MNMSNATKYTARDSATSALRKIGVTKSDYDDFIVRRDGFFYTDIEGAKKFIAKAPIEVEIKAPKLPPMQEMFAIPKKAPKTETPAAKKVSTSSQVREMILAGHTNQAVWDALGPNGSGLLKENQKAYPSWYRCELRRNGHTV
jgi:hypothetical protein